MKSVLQTDEWGQFKAKYGWQSHRLDGILVLVRRILLGKSMLYAPETSLDNKESIANLLQRTESVAKEQQSFVFRLEIALPYSEPLANTLKILRFHKSFESVQPEWRAVVDIRPSEEEILNRMHPKGRYNLRIAQKHGVEIAETKDVSDFYPLYLETARRDSFTPRSKKYFEDFLAIVPGATLFVAHLGSKALAAGLAVFYGEQASYLYGASSREERQVMAPYLLHWEIMQEAKRQGCTSYDLGEIPPPDPENHPLKGLRDFKMKFGAQAIHLLGSWDYIYQPMWYTIFRSGEKLRRGFRAQ